MMEEKPKKSWWPFQSLIGRALVETTLSTTVPIEIAIQKLRGFIADQEAKIVKTSQNALHLEVSDDRASTRRAGDRPTTFVIELALSQRHSERTNSSGLAAGAYAETQIGVIIRPRRERDRRHDANVEKARRLLGSLKSYLMAREDDDRLPDPDSESLAEAVQD